MPRTDRFRPAAYRAAAAPKAVDPLRRRLLAAGLAAGAFPALSLAAATSAARPDDPRFVFVILRGGMDGLSAVPAPGDPAFAAARGALAAPGNLPALPLPGPFALHPALAGLHGLVTGGEAVVVQAAGLPYRERSHFDAQQVLESGGARPYELTDGWLGRALQASGVGGLSGLALGASVPLVLRGAEAVDSWSPSALAEPPGDLLDRLQMLYGADAALGAALQRARVLHGEPPAAMSMPPAGGAAMAGPAGTPPPRAAVVLARRAGEFLSQPVGPRVAVLDIGGWDTHAAQARTLEGQLKLLDDTLAALRTALQQGGAWGRTVAVVATEFGRQVAINGTGGTDHGSGGAAFVLGGAVQGQPGGRVIADWPGLAENQRFEGRDLRITTDLRSLLRPLLADHLKVPTAALDRQVFPGSAGLPRLQAGLLKTAA